MVTSKIPNNLPDKNKTIEIADDYLKSNKLLTAEHGPVHVTACTLSSIDSNNTVINKTTLFWEVSYIRTIDGTEVLGPGNHLDVSVGDNGEVIGVFNAWRDIKPYKRMDLKSFDQAYLALKNGEVIPNKYGDGNKVVITNASLGYYMDAAESNQSYVMPVYVFKGDMYNDNVLVQAGGFSAYVPALEDESELP